MKFVLFFLCICAAFSLFVGPITTGVRQAQHNVLLQQSRTVGQILFNFATDNTTGGNAYPDGASSTEVFQKLIDAGYASDPAVFYFPMPGKIEPVAGQKLKPENVCFDYTSGIGASPAQGVPLVFATGFRVDYKAGGSAVPFKQYVRESFALRRTWAQWWHGEPVRQSEIAEAIAVFYEGNNAAILKRESDGSIRNFVPPDFKPDGKTYRQLTPEGELR